jgi:hypothetical protein
MSEGREQLLLRTGSLTTYYEDEKRVPFLLRFLNILWNTAIFYGIEKELATADRVLRWTF